ncbi:hypothetical protein [Nocardioides sp.]|uniref:hypothetical protein n=1 Tax=Nocardioides sp. TaxID=35761 RepID=UPI002ED3B4C7
MTTPGPDKKAGPDSPSALTKVRIRIAQLVWLLFVVCALFLAVGALLVALEANVDNPLVAFVLDGADAVDLGVFSRDNGIKQFSGANAETKNALFNWGIGAIAYLVVGRIVDRVIRP